MSKREGDTCGCPVVLVDVVEIQVTDLSKSIGYSENDLKAAPDANLGLGCGNPTAFSKLNLGDTVLDLGSGAGFDCFLAVQKVGRSGKVIGVDMTQAMVKSI